MRRFGAGAGTAPSTTETALGLQSRRPRRIYFAIRCVTFRHEALEAALGGFDVASFLFRHGASPLGPTKAVTIGQRARTVANLALPSVERMGYADEQVWNERQLGTVTLQNKGFLCFRFLPDSGHTIDYACY